jgi:hypothetical protein
MDEHQRLITFQELEDEALGALPSTTDGSALQDVAEKAIEYATRQIEEYLQRRLIVRERTDLGRNVELEFDYDVSTNEVSYYSFYTGDWPVLEPIEVFPDDYTLQVHPDGRRFFTEFDNFNYAIRRVRYFAGYRRPGQTLADLQATEELSELTAEPPPLPEDIRAACLRLTVHRLQAMKGEGLGLGQRELRLSAGQTVQTAGVDADFPQQELESIDKHRSVAW